MSCLEGGLIRVKKGRFLGRSNFYAKIVVKQGEGVAHTKCEVFVAFFGGFPNNQNISPRKFPWIK